MSSEYVFLSSVENQFGQKHLLHSQLELLDSVKRLQIYKNLREQELMLKLQLKVKLQQTIALFEKLDKLLPVSRYQETLEERRARLDMNKKENHEYSLEMEIAAVQRKISTLQSGM